MPLHIFRIAPFDHIAKAKLFEEICQPLQKTYQNSDEHCIIIANYTIEGATVDALIANSDGFRILLFKDYGGTIRAQENGDWTANGLIIEGEALARTPLAQITRCRQCVTKGLNSLLGTPQDISAAIVFCRDAEIDSTALAPATKAWLSVCDHRHPSTILPPPSSLHHQTPSICLIPQRLKIEGFETPTPQEQDASSSFNRHPSPISPLPLTADTFFDELLSAISHPVPNHRKVYQAMNFTFKKCLNQKINDTNINFSGDFAKTDFLLKEHNAPASLVRSTHDMRVRFRKQHELSDDELQTFCLLDLKNLCLFISFVYKADIPQRLAALFPSANTPHQPSSINHQPSTANHQPASIRVIVDAWDDHFIYAQAEQPTDDEPIKICYNPATNNLQPPPTSFPYLKPLLHQGTQLNLVRPRETDNILYPELIIYEPDYLVNISTVAHCFTNYADSALVELVKKLEPQRITEQIVLGNFAGQLLDEAIHQLPDTYPYAQSVKTFFRDHAVSLLTANPGPQFHDEARRQQKNIAQAIHTTLPQQVPQFNSKEGIVEPSFFCEMLGLQGRMDYLQLDFKVLMEQKSGKGAFPYNNFTKPIQTTEHYVQMLLYVALIRYNFSEIYRQNGGVRAFLLYSKYTSSLLDPGYAATELLQQAFQVRNTLAWAELLYAQPNGYRILETLTPERLNAKHVNNRLWTDWQRPQIASVLDPIQQASPLEKAYFFRFMTFIANEHVMAKLGNKTKESSGFAATWHDTLDEKRLAGNIYDNLTLISPDNTTTGPIKSVLLKFAETEDNDMSNFRVGDIVILYPYEKGKEPDARKTMVHRCTIEHITTDTIRLSLRAAQADNRVFARQTDKPWAIEHDFMESSFSSLYRGMHAFLLAPQQRRDLLLLQRTPQIDYTSTLKGDYGTFNPLALRVKRAKDLFLIIGPPGTGKTSFGLLYTVKEELLEPHSSVLLLSYTNRAVDEICSKLTEEGIDFIRMGGSYSCAEEYQDKLISSKVQQSNTTSELKDTLVHTRVFVGTTTALNSNIALFQLKQFSLAVIDEASQILEPHLIPLLSAHYQGVPAIRKFVLIGDHKQLPAVVQQKEEVSKVYEPLLNDILLSDCRLSLFERLLKKYAHNDDVVYMLRKQGRMHQDIALFPNIAFYNGQLEVVPLPHQLAPLPQRHNPSSKPTDRHDSGNLSSLLRQPSSLLPPTSLTSLLQTQRIAFIATQQPEDSPSDKVNLVEAEMIAATVAKIYEIEQPYGFDPDKTVGVIVPYRNQIAAVRKAIAQQQNKSSLFTLHSSLENHSPLDSITIDTVERFQGSQRKYILYGFTVQQYYQLNFLTNNQFFDTTDGSIVDRKLNVAMTRAEEHLIMFGNAELLANNLTFAKLIDFLRSKQAFYQIDKDDYVAGRFTLPTNL